MVDIETVLATAFWGNTVQDYAIATGMLIAGILVLWFFKFVIIQRFKRLAERTKNDLDDMVIEAGNAIGWPFYVILSVFVALKSLSVHPALDKGVYFLLIITLTFYAGRIVHKIISFFAEKWDKKNDKKGSVAHSPIVNMLKTFAQAVLWIIVILVILDNLGFDVTTMLAGIGIGGVAIAIALQGILSDVFASVSIYFDKPFEVGDFIIIGADMGTVEKIGIKSTRIRTLQGQELVVSNQELTSSRINNYKKMQRRRIVFSFGVTYDTPASKLQRIPGVVKKIIDKEDLADIDRCHFKSFDDSSLTFEVVYYMKVSDYNKYMDTQQSINLEIVKAFDKAKIEMAFPTRTVHLKK
ncbi:mechanosensitive ion channel family protein [Candidatus Woesearchaeota archaeon]|nr:mechanosensitive ion channel family protein [Candidatus Woesearchaeota archaeon]